MNYLNLAEAKNCYKKGLNITEYLRNKFNHDVNTSEIIEIAYDLQAGSYINELEITRSQQERYTSDLAKILNIQIENDDTILDIGSGELTTLTLVLNRIDKKNLNIFALDISWSRLKKGMQFYSENKNRSAHKLKSFVADIKLIPLHSKCIDIVTSSHALEPNGSNLPLLLKELFRIAKRRLVLFEPSYELNSDEGKKRMDKLGYIKNLEVEVTKLGGKVRDVIPVYDREIPLNPTVCYLIDLPESDIPLCDNPLFCVPGTNHKLTFNNYFMESKDTGLVFPILDDIPILRSNSSILATAKF